MTNTTRVAAHPPASDILNCMSEALIFADTKGIIQTWNPGAEVLFGYPAEEAIGKSLDIIIPEKLRKAHWDGYNRAVSSGETKYGRRTMITRAIHRNGEQIYVDMSFAVVKNRAGEPTGSVAVASDANQRYLEEKKLRRQLSELAANQAK
jgi:PAS domain S-box-containing protein